MLVKEVIEKYHAIVPFPWTPKKIELSGLNPCELAIDVAEELFKCEDVQVDAVAQGAVMEKTNEQLLTALSKTKRE